MKSFWLINDIALLLSSFWNGKQMFQNVLQLRKCHQIFFLHYATAELTLVPVFVVKLWKRMCGYASEVCGMSLTSCRMTVLLMPKYAVGPKGK